MKQKEEGRPKGSPTRPTIFNNTVYSYIPEDGSRIRHKELMAKCVHSGKMAYQSMQDALERLITNGSIVRDRIKSKRGAGRGYRRIVKYRENGNLIPHDVKSLSEILKNRTKDALLEQYEYSQAKKGLANVYDAFTIILATIVFPEMIEYAKNTDKEQAKKRLMAVLQERISFMFMQIAEDGVNPAMLEFKEQTMVAFEMMLDKGFIALGSGKPQKDLWHAALEESKYNREGITYCGLSIQKDKHGKYHLYHA